MTDGTLLVTRTYPQNVYTDCSQQDGKESQFKTTANINSSEDTQHAYFKILQFHRNTHICYIHRQRKWTD